MDLPIFIYWILLTLWDVKEIFFFVPIPLMARAQNTGRTRTFDTITLTKANTGKAYKSIDLTDADKLLSKLTMIVTLGDITVSGGITPAWNSDAQDQIITEVGLKLNTNVDLKNYNWYRRKQIRKMEKAFASLPAGVLTIDLPPTNFKEELKKAYYLPIWRLKALDLKLTINSLENLVTTNYALITDIGTTTIEIQFEEFEQAYAKGIKEFFIHKEVEVLHPITSTGAWSRQEKLPRGAAYKRLAIMNHNSSDVANNTTLTRIKLRLDDSEDLIDASFVGLQKRDLEEYKLASALTGLVLLDFGFLESIGGAVPSGRLTSFKISYFNSAKINVYVISSEIQPLLSFVELKKLRL